MTEKHQQEARELESTWPERIWIDKDGLRNFQSRGVMSCYPNHYAPVPELSMEYLPRFALSSRDREIREVLEGLVVSVVDGENCWCPDPFSADTEKHDTACLAARELWERVQS